MYAVYAKLRDEKGVSDGAVASALGFSATTLYDWRDGKYTPKVDKLLKLASFFGVSIEVFLEAENDKAGSD